MAAKERPQAGLVVAEVAAVRRAEMSGRPSLRFEFGGQKRIRDEMPKRGGGKNEAVGEASKALSESLTEIEGTILQTKSEAPQDILNFTPQLDNQLLNLMGVVESATGRPTAASRDFFDELSGELAAIESRLDRVLAEELPAFERAVDAAGAGRVIMPPAG